MQMWTVRSSIRPFLRFTFNIIFYCIFYWDIKSLIKEFITQALINKDIIKDVNYIISSTLTIPFIQFNFKLKFKNFI